MLPHDYDTLYKVSMKLDENWERSSVSNIVELEILQSAPNDPKPTQAIGHERYPTCVGHKTLSPKFSSVLLYGQPFPRYFTS